MAIENNVEHVSITALWPRQDATAQAQPPSLLTLPPDESNTRQAMSPDAIRDTADRLNQELVRRGIEFDIHDDSGRIVTRVVDRESGELIRQIPTEEMLELARRAADDEGFLLEIRA